MPALEEGRADDDLPGARAQDVLRAFDGPHASADAAGECAGNLPDERQVLARAHGGVQIDDLHGREALEPPHPRKHVVVANGEPFALDELHDGATLEID